MRLSPVVQSLTEPLLSPLVSAITGASGSGFSPRSLFADGSKGVVYDNNDFVDSATWRRNLLTYSEQFDNAAWLKQATGTGVIPVVTPNFGVAPDGTTTADRIVFDLGATPASAYSRVGQFNLTTNTSIRSKSVWLKTTDGTTKTLYFQGPQTGNTALTVTGEWTRFSVSDSTPAVSAYAQMQFGLDSTTSTTASVLAWGAQVEENAPTATTYQRITNFNSDFLEAFPSTTLFLDSAGTTAATVNGLVGLQLDKSANLALGAELLSTGAVGLTGSATVATYNTGTGAGTVTRVDGANQSFVTFTGLSATTFYKVTIQNTGSNILSFRQGTFASTILGDIGVGETKTFLGLATISQLTITMSPVAGSGSFTVVSFKAQSGNHRYQNTTGSKPVLRGTPTGANLVTNGDFASGTGWTVGAGWAITAGQLVATAATGIVSRTVTLTGGRVYRLTIGTNTANLQIRFVGGTGQSITFASGSPVVTYFTYTAGAGNTFEIVANGTTTGVVDNVEIHDVSAGSVTAPYGLQYDGVDDFLQTAAVDFATATSDGLARRNLASNPKALDTYATLLTPIVTANAAAAPDGSMTATQIQVGAGQTAFALRNAGPTSLVGNQANSIYFKLVGSTTGTLGVLRSDRDPSYCGVNVATRAPLTTNAAGVSNSSVTIETLPDGWYRLKGAYTSDISTETRIQLTNSTAGDKILLWGLQTEQGTLTVTDFQNIGTDKMFVCAGVRKLSDAAVAMLFEHSANGDSTNGTFYITAPSSIGTDRYRLWTRGTVGSTATALGFAAPNTHVVSGIAEIATDTNIIRVNGVQAATGATDQGTGNYSSNSLYFGRRGGVSLPYNGLDFGMVICGKTLTSTQIANTERWMSYRTGVTL